MFLQTNDRLVNLQNVSNINILEREKRIVFNMNYSIEIQKRGRDILISDYCYWDLVTDTQFEEAIKLVKYNEYVMSNFITHNNAIVNTNCISSVKFSDKKRRIIFNLSHPKTIIDYNGVDSISSEFVYFDFKDYNEFKTSTEAIKLILGVN